MRQNTLRETVDYLSDLNPEQRMAVEKVEGPLLVFAGAGSGKTRVLTRRIAHLILAHKVHPEQILAVTFTNKAAKEMRERVVAALSHFASASWISTFHSVCVRILREHAHLLDFTRSFAIYDSDESLAALKRVYKRLNIDQKLIDPKMVRSAIDRAKNYYRQPEDMRDDTTLSSEWTNVIAQLYEEYQKELHASNAMDFGDLLCNVVTLFKLEPTVLDRYQTQFKYLLIDEYQDTNPVQYQFIQLLTQKNKNICVVGDDDQSIYAFRGATIENILRFKKDYPEAEVITLDTNYRSTKAILEVANAIIEKNTKRQPKRMKTPNAKGDLVLSLKAYDERDEARFVVQEIVSALNQGTRLSDMAIFYRTNAQSRAFEEALVEEGLPYEIFGGFKFYERKEIRDVIGYMRLALNNKDNESFLRVINTPARGLGAAAIGNISTVSAAERVSMFEATRKVIEKKPNGFSKAVIKKLEDFTSIIEGFALEAEKVESSLKKACAEETFIDARDLVANFLKHIAERSGYIPALKKQDSIEAESRIENIAELYRVAVEFVEREIEQQLVPSLSTFLDRMSLSSGDDKENVTSVNVDTKEKDAISLMTLHLAKGLEFDMVFLTGLEEGLLPHIRSIQNPKEIEEERRLCYVGITRARKKLYLTRAIMRHSFGRSNWYSGEASRFIWDIPGDTLKEVNSSSWD